MAFTVPVIFCFSFYLVLFAPCNLQSTRVAVCFARSIYMCLFLFINFCRIWYFLFTYHKKRKKTMYIFHSMSYQHFSQNDMMYI